ncbi:hypothetical protein LEMLEM_LOCUS773 [Lemmus lemmus]
MCSSVPPPSCTCVPSVWTDTGQ